MLVGWGILSPFFRCSGLAPGPVDNMDVGARSWMLWISVVVMCADSFVSISPIILEHITTIVLRLRGHRVTDGDESDDVEPEDRNVPNTWVVGGLGLSVML